MKKLWDKGWNTDPGIIEFTSGRDREFDTKMAAWDIIGSMAHTAMLGSCGLLTKNETESLFENLMLLYVKAEAGTMAVGEGVEDIHSQVELLLTEKLGDTGRKIHSGRSRNDQVLVDLRLFLRQEAGELAQKVSELAHQLLKLAADNSHLLMPGYTHMQLGMVSSFGLWYSSWAESLVDDLLVLQASQKLIDRNPLGTAAGYGTDLPISREITTELLCFSSMTVSSAYAQASRVKSDMAFVNGLSAIAHTIGKMADDIILFTGENFRFFTLEDSITTGSSIMPQKKNPDLLEIIRSKCNLIASLPGQIALVTTNLNSGYHRDYQCLKELVFKGLVEIVEIIRFTSLALEKTSCNPGIFENPLLKPALATSLANSMVKEGTPFRTAYRDVAENYATSDLAPPKPGEYTHTGSIGNLALEHIQTRLDTVLAAFNTPEKEEIIGNISSAIEALPE